MRGKWKIGEYEKKNEASLDLFIYLYNLDLFGRCVLICVIIFVRIYLYNLDLLRKERAGKEKIKKRYWIFKKKKFNA